MCFLRPIRLYFTFGLLLSGSHAVQYILLLLYEINVIKHINIDIDE